MEPVNSDSKWIEITEKKLWLITLVQALLDPVMFIMCWFAISGFIKWGDELCPNDSYWSVCVHGFAILFTIIVSQPFFAFFLITFISSLVMRIMDINWIQVSQKWKLKIKPYDEDSYEYPLWTQNPSQ